MVSSPTSGSVGELKRANCLMYVCAYITLTLVHTARSMYISICMDVDTSTLMLGTTTSTGWNHSILDCD